MVAISHPSTPPAARGIVPIATIFRTRATAATMNESFCFFFQKEALS
jgi:hypothetical protein